VPHIIVHAAKQYGYNRCYNFRSDGQCFDEGKRVSWPDDRDDEKEQNGSDPLFFIHELLKESEIKNGCQNNTDQEINFHGSSFFFFIMIAYLLNFVKKKP
jgi:hypothetical protein